MATDATLLGRLNKVAKSRVPVFQPGEAEANLRKAFDEARKHAPALVFLDEVDAIAPRGKQGASGDQRRVVRALGELLDELERDHAHAAVVVLAATNRVGAVDPSLRRYGRRVRVHVQEPSLQDCNGGFNAKRSTNSEVRGRSSCGKMRSRLPKAA